jgi:UDP-N-acetylglucosamine 2-epimerase (non-hydrolysing)
MLGSIVAAISEISRDLPLVFPVHPRTRQRLQAASAGWPASNVQVIDPLGYVEFLDLQRHAAVVMTDSGGVQEETTFLGVPCLTLRDGTERPVTVTLGTNILVGSDMEQLRAQVGRILEGELKHGRVPPLWDGHTAERIARTIVKWNGRR